MAPFGVDCSNSINHEWVQVSNYCKYSLLLLPVVGIEPATSRWFHSEVLSNGEHMMQKRKCLEQNWNSLLLWLKYNLLDIWRAYLQVCVPESLWAFHTVLIRGKRYCLTQLVFGLNVALLIMKYIIKTVLPQEMLTIKATPSYVDDIFVNEEIMSANIIKMKVESFGLTCKDSKHLKYWATGSSGSTTPCAGNEGLQFQNPLLRWCDTPHFPSVGSW